MLRPGFFFLSWVFFSSLVLTACGADSSSSYTPTEDSVSTEAQISFNPTQNTIIIKEAGPTARSNLITPCEISFESLELSYELVSSREVQLNERSFTLVETIENLTPPSGVPQALMAIWTAEPQSFSGGVTNQIEIEIRPSSLTYRNKCLR